MTYSISLVLVHRSPTMGRALALLLEDSGHCDVLKTTFSSQDALAAVRDSSPQVVLVDPQLPGTEFGVFLDSLQEAAPTCRIVVLTSSCDPDYLHEAMKAGATAYLSTASDPSELVRKLRLAAEGHLLVSGPLTTGLLGLIRTSSKGHPVISDSSVLTGRETEVVDLVSHGYTNREVAGALVVTENTVKVHLRNVYRKLDVRNRHQLMAKMLQSGLARSA